MLFCYPSVKVLYNYTNKKEEDLIMSQTNEMVKRQLDY
jgi:hypothetical protein